MKIEIDVDIPKGWEFYRYDYLYYKDQSLTMVDPWPYCTRSENKHIIIKKKKIVTEKYRRYVYKNSNGGYSVGILLHTNVREEDYQWIDKDWITEEIS